MTEAELEECWGPLTDALKQAADLEQNAARCTYSELKPSQCAHCLGHKAEGDDVEAAARKKVMYG